MAESTEKTRGGSLGFRVDDNLVHYELLDMNARQRAAFLFARAKGKSEREAILVARERKEENES